MTERGNNYNYCLYFIKLQKKLVLPNMEDLVVPLLSSGLDEDKMIKDKIPS